MKKPVCLSSESSFDLPLALRLELDIHVIPLTIILGEKEEEDGNIPARKIYDYVEYSGKLARTAAINSYAYEAYFDSLLEEYERVIHISLSSRLSATCQNAILASQNPKYEGKVTVIDSRSVSSAIGLLAVRCATLAKEGKSVPEILKAYESFKSDVHVSFFVEKLEYLAKGGRCSKLALFGANLLKLHPQIVVRDGALVPGEKYRGPLSKVVKEYLASVEEEAPTFDPSLAIIAHTVMPEEVLFQVRDRLYERGFTRVEIVEASGAISCHCGPHAFGVIYFKK
ncbi:MAG: DegV family protein [Bacillales bacterium]|nr:DegV family protein [Bacillales bacterium]MDY5920220.1 DegV family protein [Candidatus Enteromonas sp.]